MCTVVYRIDELDRLVEANEDWDSFADANRGEKLRRAAVFGRNLFDFLADETVRDLYRAIIRRARSGHVVQYRYRCDAPDRRREFAMQVRGGPNGEVEFRSTLAAEAERAVARTVNAPLAAALSLCSWCHAVQRDGGEWMALETALATEPVFDRAGLQHAICPQCLANMLDRLRH